MTFNTQIILPEWIIKLDDILKEARIEKAEPSQESYGEVKTG